MAMGPTDLCGSIDRLRKHGEVEVREDRRWNPELSDWRYEVKDRGGQLILHLWSSDSSVTRRVLGKTEESEDRLVLRVDRFGRGPGRLEFVLTDATKSNLQLERGRFLSRIQKALAVWFPDEEISSITAAKDLEKSFSGSYTRGVSVTRGRSLWAFIAVAVSESPATIDAILTFGILWLDWVRGHSQGKTVSGLRLFVPRGSSRTTIHRLQGLNRSVRVEVFEMEESLQSVSPVDTQDVGNLDTRLKPYKEIERALQNVATEAEKIRRLAPEAIEATALTGSDGVALRFYGLEFARYKDGQVRIVLTSPTKRGEKTVPTNIKDVVKSLDRIRKPMTADASHPWYRNSAERWLETLVRADPCRIDARLEPSRIYSQVPAFAAGDRGVMDLLGATRDGRLAVVELKATEDIHLVMQAMDYWGRVRWHQERGELERFGYFPEGGIRDVPPLLYLVAPSLRFHPASDVLLRYLSPEIEVQRVGLNEDWRSGLQVVFRQ